MTEYSRTLDGIICDRCGTSYDRDNWQDKEDNLTLYRVTSSHNKLRDVEEVARLDTGLLPIHLCHQCTPQFFKFMNEVQHRAAT